MNGRSPRLLDAGAAEVDEAEARGSAGRSRGSRCRRTRPVVSGEFCTMPNGTTAPGTTKPGGERPDHRVDLGRQIRVRRGRHAGQDHHPHHQTSPHRMLQRRQWFEMADRSPVRSAAHGRGAADGPAHRRAEVVRRQPRARRDRPRDRPRRGDRRRRPVRFRQVDDAALHQRPRADRRRARSRSTAARSTRPAASCRGCARTSAWCSSSSTCSRT